MVVDVFVADTKAGVSVGVVAPAEDAGGRQIAWKKVTELVDAIRCGPGPAAVAVEAMYCDNTRQGEKSVEEAGVAEVRHYVLNHRINTLGDDLKALRGLAKGCTLRTGRWSGLWDRLVGWRRRVGCCRRRSVAGSKRDQPRDVRQARRGHSCCDLAMEVCLPELQLCG